MPDDDASDPVGTGTPAGETAADAFQLLHARTSRQISGYIARRCRDAGAVDDLVQEVYLRFLRARLPADMDPAHQRNYLYRVATNVLHDHKHKERGRIERDTEFYRTGRDGAQTGFDEAPDVRRALDALKPKESDMLWLAYVERFTHAEIASILRLRAPSIRPLLFRARRKLAALLGRQRGPSSGQKT